MGLINVAEWFIHSFIHSFTSERNLNSLREMHKEGIVLVSNSLCTYCNFWNVHPSFTPPFIFSRDTLWLALLLQWYQSDVDVCLLLSDFNLQTPILICVFILPMKTYTFQGGWEGSIAKALTLKLSDIENSHQLQEGGGTFLCWL